jgi:hypothetical protein
VVVRQTAATAGIKTPDGLVVAPATTPESQRAATQFLTPEKYAIPNTSGLSANVKPGCGPLDFNLTSK